MSYRDYGVNSVVGIGTPQANPNVEAEMRLLLPPTILIQVSRLTSRAASLDDRVREYLTELGSTLEAYDSLKLDAYGFACTGSSYLVGRDEELRLMERFSRLKDCPVITATEAIYARFKAAGVKRIALTAPYPDDLFRAAVAYWKGLGLEVSQTHRISVGGGDIGAIQKIYALTNVDARAALATLQHADVDAILASGTGMPTLAALKSVTPANAGLVLSSNYCLAWAICECLGLTPGPGEADMPPLLERVPGLPVEPD